MLTYSVRPQSLGSHYFAVNLTFTADHPEGLTLQLPAWIPGSYMIRDFARHVVEFAANGPGGPLAYKRPDKNTWALPPCQGEVEVYYLVYANDLSVRTAYLDQTLGFFNPAALCLEVPGLNEVPHQLQVKGLPAGWQQASGLPANGVANNYQELIDFPVLLGELTRIPFQAHGIEHELVLAGRHFAASAQLAEDLQAICEYQIDLWGEAPFDRYTFLTMVAGEGFGGLEHSNSTALLCSRHCLEYGQEQPDDDYLTFLSLCSHEYFHSWNVKRLRPATFVPYQLQTEQYTEQLWFYEGVTSYYDDLVVHLAGCTSAERFLARLSQTLTRALRGKGPQRQTVAESSRLAWTTFYQQNENAQNAISSYYAKGAAMVLGLDLLIRQHQRGQASFAEVLRTLWQESGKTESGTQPEQLERVITEYGGQAAADFLYRALYTTNPLPLEPLLRSQGLAIEPAWPEALSMQPQLSAVKPAAVSLGAVLQPAGEWLQVARTFEGQAAAQAGVSAGDKLIAIDYLQAHERNVRRALMRYSPGDTVRIHVLRQDELLELELTFMSPEAQGLWLTIQQPDKVAEWLSIPPA